MVISVEIKVDGMTYTVVFLDHLHKGVLGETVFADGREICRLPSRAIQILLDLGGHVGACG